MTFYLDMVESAVLGGLKAELGAPKVISEYIRTYLEVRKRLAASSNAKRQRLEQHLGQLNREIERLVDAIAKGHGDPSVLGPRSTALDAERKRISEELHSEPPTSKDVALHPDILKRYEEPRKGPGGRRRGRRSHQAPGRHGHRVPRSRAPK